MYAIIETGGKQYRVVAGDVIEVEKLACAEGEEVVFDRVLLVEKDGKASIGTPTLAGATAVGRILDHGRGRKIRGFKYKPKVNYRRRFGHRQPFTRVYIEGIKLGGSKVRAES